MMLLMMVIVIFVIIRLFLCLSDNNRPLLDLWLVIDDAGLDTLLIFLLVDDLCVLFAWIIFSDMLVVMIVMIFGDFMTMLLLVVMLWMMLKLALLVDGCHEITVACRMLLLRLMTCGWQIVRSRRHLNDSWRCGMVIIALLTRWDLIVSVSDVLDFDVLLGIMLLLMLWLLLTVMM